jgi:hypothetical protein
MSDAAVGKDVSVGLPAALPAAGGQPAGRAAGETAHVADPSLSLYWYIHSTKTRDDIKSPALLFYINAM